MSGVYYKKLIILLQGYNNHNHNNHNNHNHNNTIFKKYCILITYEYKYKQKNY